MPSLDKIDWMLLAVLPFGVYYAIFVDNRNVYWISFKALVLVGTLLGWGFLRRRTNDET